MRLIWEPDALRDLETAADWSVAQAIAVVDAMERMADRGFSLGRPLAGTTLRYWPVPPLAVVYRIVSNQLHVEAVVDMRGCEKDLTDRHQQATIRRGPRANAECRMSRNGDGLRPYGESARDGRPTGGAQR